MRERGVMELKDCQGGITEDKIIQAHSPLLINLELKNICKFGVRI